MSSMTKQVFLLAAIGSASVVAPSPAVGQQTGHVGVYTSSVPTSEVVLHHAQISSTPHRSAKSDKVIVEKFAKMPVIGNGIVAATPERGERDTTTTEVAARRLRAIHSQDEPAVERPARLPVIGGGLVTATPTANAKKGEGAAAHAAAKTPAVRSSAAQGAAARRPLALGRVASAVNSTVNGTTSGDAPSVWCGGEYAASCATCPQGNGAMWCHGHCHWTGLQCVLLGQPAAAKDAAMSISKALVAASSAKTPAKKLSWARGEEGPVAAIHRAKATKTLSHASQASGSGVGHFLSAYKNADECTCAFHGVCTCEASMAFMQCISNSCQAGCDCHELQYKDACRNLQSACGDMGLTFDCDADKATCVAHEHTTTRPPPKVEKTAIHARPLPHLDPPSQADPVTFLYNSLVEMKEDKCQLEAAVKGGYVNADDRAGLLIPQIEAKLGDLEAKCLKIPELRCDKDFEEYSGYPTGHRCGPKPLSAPRSGSSFTHLALGVAALVAAQVINF